MRTIPLTKGKTALVDDDDFERLSRHSWSAYERRGLWYARRGTRNRKLGVQKLISMHREILNAPDGIDVDHRDRDGLNNQKYNLRLCNSKQNGCNSRFYSSNTSGFRGVSRAMSKTNPWQASIRIDGKQKYLGIFSDRLAAAMAYNNAALEFHGEFARINELT
jgi:hypothetical protein